MAACHFLIKSRPWRMVHLIQPQQEQPGFFLSTTTPKNILWQNVSVTWLFWFFVDFRLLADFQEEDSLELSFQSWSVVTEGKKTPFGWRHIFPLTRMLTQVILQIRWWTEMFTFSFSLVFSSRFTSSVTDPVSVCSEWMTMAAVVDLW